MTVKEYNSPKGPYWIESSLGKRTYTLCDKDGYPVSQWVDVVKEKDLKEYVG